MKIIEPTQRRLHALSATRESEGYQVLEAHLNGQLSRVAVECTTFQADHARWAYLAGQIEGLKAALASLDNLIVQTKSALEREEQKSSRFERVL